MDKQRFDIIIGMQTGEITKGVKAANGDLKSLKQALKDTLSALPGGNNITKQLKDARTQVAALVRELDKMQKTGKTNLAQFTPKQRGNVLAGVEQAKQSVTGAAPSNLAKAEAAAASKLQSKAITLRYAMYDVSSAFNSASQAALGFAGAVVQAQIAQERAFSAIQKTQVGKGSPEETVKTLAKLKDELIDLSNQIPLSFSELTKIGMLGSQMGVEAKDIAKFTEVTAKFSAITGTSAEDSAMNIGKVAGLLGLQADQYQSLASAIVGVGFASKATETQIIATAGQIGAIAKAAGLSASDVIGLSSAMASLKIAPEEARGVIQPTFAAMSAAARSFNADLGYGSEKLNVFAKISGMSAEDFATQWGSGTAEGAGTVWRSFTEGLGKVDTGQALVQLGLDGVRTSKGLTALASGAEEMGRQMKVALETGTAGTFLDDSFATQVDDLASRLELLQNSFDNLAAAVAGNKTFTDVLKNMVDIMRAVNIGLTNMLNANSFISGATAVAIAVAAIGGALLAVAATVAVSYGGFLALRTAFQAAIVEGVIFKGSLGGIIASLFGLVPAQRAVAVGFNTMEAGAIGAKTGIIGMVFSLRTLKLALASTGIGLVALAIGYVAEALMNLDQPTDEAVVSLNKVRSGAGAAKESLSPLISEIEAFITEILKVPGATTDFNNSMYALGQAVQKNGNYFGDASQAGRDNLTAFRATLVSMFAASAGSEQVYGNSLIAYRDHLASIGLLTAQMRGEIDRVLLGINFSLDPTAAISGAKAYEEGFKKITTGAGNAKTALEKLDELLQRVFRPMDAILGVQDSLDSLGASIAKNGKLVGYSTQGMRDNFKALKDVIFAFKDSSNGNLQVFANNLVALRASMVKMGVTSKTAFDEIDKSLAAVKTKGKLNAKQLAAVYSAINDSMVEEQKKNIRTISDYVSDLSGVLTKAFENRYGRQAARDSITSAWISIKEAADDAKKSIDDANQSLDTIKADRKVLEYQLGVAVKYGDTLRAQSIQTKLNELTKKAAEEQGKLTEAQTVTNKSLTDNSKAGIANRSTVRDLIQSGNAYLMTLAQTGMSSAGLKDEAAKLTDEFLTQGEQLGFSRTELEAYTKYFATDFTAVLDSLEPYKNITIEVTTDYAMNAINEFVANAKSALASIPDVMPASEAQVSNIQTGVFSTKPTSTGGGAGGGQAAAVAAEALKQRRLAAAAAATAKATAAKTAAAKALASKVPAQAKILATVKQINELEALSKEDNGWTAFFNPNRYNFVHERVKSLRMEIAAFKSTYGAQWLTNVHGPTELVQGYATGGFISGSGSSTSDSIPAMLSNGEYVIKANAVNKYGVDFMNSLNQMQVQRGSQSGSASGGSSVVYLSPEDRQLLRAAADRPIALYTENTKIAQSANAGNVMLAQRGTN